MTEPAYHLVNTKALTNVILLAEHAGAHFPNADTLGINPDLFVDERNLPFDYGVNNITLSLAEKLGATAILGHYSRLLVDLNRTPDSHDLIPVTAHGISIPGNQNISDAERAHRLQEYYWPFHRVVEEQINRHLAAGIKPLLFAVHSFTPSVGLKQSSDPLAEVPDIGFLYLEENNFLEKMRSSLRKQGVRTADNFPYDLRKISTGGLHMHGIPHNLPILGIEISIDKLRLPEDEIKWAKCLYQSFDQIFVVQIADVDARENTRISIH